VAWARHDLGLLARDRGDLGTAARLLRQSLRDFRELHYAWAVAWSAWGLGTTLSAQGALGEACPLLAEALRIHAELSDPRGVPQCLEALARIACEQAHFETAARLIGAAAVLRARMAAPAPDAEQARTLAVERAVTAALGAEATDQFMHAGRAMPAGQAVDLAMAVAVGAAPGDGDRPQQVPLTPRERQVAALVASGRTNRQIGRVLGISEKTTEVHLHHVMSKLDVRSRAEVAAWAVTQGDQTARRLEGDDGKTASHRAVRARAGSRRGRRGRPVLQARLLATADRQHRNCPGVRGLRPEVPEALMIWP
jgi:non-specific serine/threonine protein kinase